VIGAIRLCGRWIDQQVLDRLSRRSQGPSPPPRRQLIEDFCHAVRWRNAKGELCVSSASAALRRLEEDQRVLLPPKAPARQRSGTRGLRDDGQPLPPRPDLRRTGAAIAGLRLRLIQDEHDPAHALWNRLIVREHPLGRRPLFGAQLRYLIECDVGIIGAFGFGPPAFHLECRDHWIGWSLTAHRQNLGQVIGLSRFLIRPQLRVSHLASQCYGLVLRRIAGDWQARYGIKPVLVETYVDRVHHNGRSLAAANWRRLGQSKGRGRDDPQRQRAQSPKDVWVCELCSQARTHLQACAVEVLAPRSVFAPPLQTARRMAAENVVLLAQDTTILSCHSLRQTTGLGNVGEDYSRGLFLHTLQAFRLDGIPLGTAWAELWARPADTDTAQRNEQSFDQKESGRWIRAFQAGSQRARQMPQTVVLICGDRESDIYELYDQKQAAPANVHLLVRGQHDRALSDGTRLRESLAQVPVGGTLDVYVPRSGERPARTATLELRWKELEVKPPAVALKKSWPNLKLYALGAREVDPPKGVEPIDWLLLTTWPITSLKMARRLVRWYALRWGIECWHKVLKVVCGVERRQMKSAQALERALAFDMIVASRVLLLTRLGKEHPDLPADSFYSADELEVLAAKKRETTRFAASAQLTVLQANILTAMLGGFWGRPSDGHPGPKVLSEGIRVLQALVWYKQRCAMPVRPGGRKRNPT